MWSIRHYEPIADEVDRRVDPAVPHDVDAVHACVFGPPPWTGVRATIAKASEPVDPEIPKACPQCTETLATLDQ